MITNPVTKLREDLYLHPRIVNLNLGSCSISPRPLIAKAAQLREQMASDPVGYIWGEQLVGLENSRQALADYLKVTPAGLLLLENASFAANTLLQGLPWERGNEVVLTDQEYEHYFPLWRRIANRFGLKLQTVTLPKSTHMQDATPEDILTAFAASVTDHTTHMFFSHVTAPTGLKMPAAELIAFAQERGIKTIVDGAHAPGLIPLNLSELQPDYYFGNVHKWLMGIPSAGFLYLGDNHFIEPLLTSAYYEYDAEKMELAASPGGPSYFAANLEYHGTQDRVAQVLVKDTLEFRTQFGEKWFFGRMSDLSSYLHQQIASKGFEMVSYYGSDLSSPMVTFEIPAVDTIKAWQWFREQGFEISIKILGLKQYMRLCTPAFLLKEELDQFIELLVKVPWSDLR